MVNGPKNGNPVRFNFSGIVSAGGIPAPYSNTITFSKRGAYTVSAGVFNLAGAVASSFSGQATVKRKVISGAGSFILVDEVASATFAIQSKTKGKRRSLTVNYVVTNSSGTYPFQFVVTGKVRK